MVINKKLPPKRSATPKKDKARVLVTKPVITFTVSFFSGAGGIYFHGENIKDNQYINSSMSDNTFSVQQTAGHQIVTVAGSAPSSGKITVAVSCGAKILSPASENVFDKMTFSGFIVYII